MRALNRAPSSKPLKAFFGNKDPMNGGFNQAKRVKCREWQSRATAVTAV